MGARSASTDTGGAGDVVRLDTLPDIVRKLRRASMEIGAGHFSLFYVAPRASDRCLVPCLDSEYPSTSQQTHQLQQLKADRLAARVARSTIPMWWSEEGLGYPGVIAGPHLAERISMPGLTASGLALPLCAEGGQDGVILFTGGHFTVTWPQLADIHARCMTLFAVVARLRPMALDSGVVVSRRELECLMLTADGLTSEEIAVRLHLSVHTANQYLSNITRKLNAVNRMQAVAKALRMGLFE